jgi:hypothetical protein
MLNESILNEKIEHIKYQFHNGYSFFKGKNMNRKLSGDVYEIELRRVISELFSSYKVGYGVVYKDAESRSNEQDIIIYEGQPLFESGSLIVVSPEAVKAVIQVKGYIPNPKKDFEIIKSNIDSAKKINPSIKGFCFTVTANAKKTFPNHRAYLKEVGINLFALWDMPGNNGEQLKGTGSIEDFFITLDKALS